MLQTIVVGLLLTITLFLTPRFGWYLPIDDGYGVGQRYALSVDDETSKVYFYSHPFIRFQIDCNKSDNTITIKHDEIETVYKNNDVLYNGKWISNADYMLISLNDYVVLNTVMKHDRNRYIFVRLIFIYLLVIIGAYFGNKSIGTSFKNIFKSKKGILNFFVSSGIYLIAFLFAMRCPIVFLKNLTINYF